MHTFIIGSALESAAAVGIFGVLIAGALSLIALLFPIIVIVQLMTLNGKMAEQIQATKTLTEEAQRQNILTRQILVASGHDPHA
jgi:hypothetical protein